MLSSCELMRLYRTFGKKDLQKYVLAQLNSFQKWQISSLHRDLQ